MASIVKTSLPTEFSSLSTDARDLNEARDCAVKAVALVCDVPYSVAHAALKAEGRKDRKGTRIHQYVEAVRKLGKTVEVVDPRSIISTYPSPHNGTKHVTSHHPRRFAKVWDKSRTYLMSTHGHVFVVRNGETLDWSVNKILRVKTIYEVK